MWIHYTAEGCENRLHDSQRKITGTYNASFFKEDTPLTCKTPVRGPVRSLLCFDTRQIVSRMEEFREANLRSLLKQLRTDIAMAIDDSFPVVYGLADKNIITDQLQKVSDPAPSWAKCLWTHKFWRKAVFYRTLWRKRAEKGSIRQCIHSCPGSYNREDPSSGPSGATWPKTTTWTVIPSCRSWSQTCPLVRPHGEHPPIIIYLLAQIWMSLKWFDSAGSQDVKRSSGNHKTGHIKKRNHEDSQQPQHHDKSSVEPGNGFSPPKCIASEKNVLSVKCQSKYTQMELTEEMCLVSSC